jgi:hypothetical protein
MDIEKAIIDPASTFRNPQQVVESNKLSREQKLQILRRWEYDARELEVADEEGMTAPEPPRIALDAILAALRQLGAPVNPEHSAPTKQGGQ